MKAITLISGGLDSILAAKFIQRLGIEVIPLYFKIPFCHRQKEDKTGKGGVFSLVKENLNAQLRTVDLGSEFLRLLQKPRHGFGANMNPCIDCKILMLRKAKGLFKEYEAHFAVTGEVLGQRPMSQHRQALETIEEESGLPGLVLRPLSAKLLCETIPEKRGWVDRNSLLEFNGRSRKPQLALAKGLNIKEYVNPAGGCLLTDPQFAKRLKDLITHKELSLINVELLKIGRHFRLSNLTKLIVGRNEQENKELESLAKPGDYLFLPSKQLAGPTSLGRGVFTPELINFSCGVTGRYCDLNGEKEAAIVYNKVGDTASSEGSRIKVVPIDENKLTGLRV